MNYPAASCGVIHFQFKLLRGSDPLISLPSAHTETECRPGIKHRQSKKEAFGGRCRISDRLVIHVALDDNRVVAMFDIDRPGRRILMVHLLFIMPIGMAAGISAVVIRQGHTGTEEHYDGDNG